MHEGSNFFFPSHTVTQGHWSKTPGAIPAPTPINENTRQAVRSAMVGEISSSYGLCKSALNILGNNLKECDEYRTCAIQYAEGNGEVLPSNMNGAKYDNQ